MINRILDFFKDDSATVEQLSVDDAAAVLLIEVMLADHDLDEREKDCIADILSRRLSTTKDEINLCIESAMSRHEESNDIHQYVRVINEQYGEDERFNLVVDLWRVAFADGRLDKYEDQRIRLINDLLHLHHSHFIKAKSVAQA